MKSEKISYYLFFTFCFTIPISQFVSSRMLILLVALSFFSNRKFSFIDYLKQTWDLMLYYLALLAGLLYTDDISAGWRQLETSMCLLGVPILLYRYNSFTKSSLQSFFYAFINGLLLACAICLAVAFVNYSKTGDVSSFFYDQLTKPIDAQPTYFAYYLIFAITIAMYQFYYELPKKYLGWACLVIAFFFLFLLLTGGQTAFVSLLFIFSFFLSKYLVQRNAKRESIAVLMIILAIVAMAFWVTQNSITGEISHYTLKSDYWERMVLWESAFKATPNYLLGAGTGDYTKVLNDYYLANNLAQFADANLNAHSQYFQLLLSNGIIGVIAFLLMLARPLYLSIKFQNLLGVLIFFPFVLYAINEVFLGRFQGVIFFVILHQVLIKFYYSLWPSYSTKVDNLPIN